MGTTIYVYSNEDGLQVDAIDGADNADCEAKANDKWGINDYHWSYVAASTSNALESEAKTMMSFEEFQASGREDQATEEECDGLDVAGCRRHELGCYILRLRSGEWYLMIERSEYSTSDLASLERRLYDGRYVHNI